MNRVLAVLAIILPASQTMANDDFEKLIRPLLAERCFSCHGEKKQSGGLRLDTREAILKGGERGPAVFLDKADKSLILQAILQQSDLRMPPKGKLSPKEISVLHSWVNKGLPWGKENSQTAKNNIREEHNRWRVFQPLPLVQVPRKTNGAWGQNEIDNFIIHQLEAKAIKPAPAASKRKLIRRVYFDLIGIPPTPEEVAAFEKDNRPGAFAAVVDHLLDSPLYGQRWARHWLDVVRYADYHDGNPKARNPVCEPLEAWRYRDWVVRALNSDLPFDQFILHQIAGDLLPSKDGKIPNQVGLIATGFLVNGAWDRGDADKEKMLSDMIDDQIDTIGKAFMGLTLGCARCHDHKFDPISQDDYYAMAGVFYSSHIMAELGTKGGEITLLRRPLVPQEIVKQRNRQLSQINGLNAILTDLDKKSPKVLPDDPTRELLIEQRNRIQKELVPEPPLALAVMEGGMPGSLFPNIQDVPLHIRGSYTKLGKVIPRGVPHYFAKGEQIKINQGSGRKELAEWVASKNNPLTARVIVNRVWQWHFGRGIVSTANNFGMQSEPPVLPELLDWLTGAFLADGWSLKKLHRRILLSSTCQQACESSAQAVLLDPENRIFSRFNSRRLEAEAIRDAMLFVTGQLDCVADGPATDNPLVKRRSLYVQTARWDRSNYAMLFDAANPDASVEKRDSSTVAPQALFLLNHEMVLELANHFAKRVASEIPTAGDLRIQRMFQLAFNRNPTESELKIANQLLIDDKVGKENAWQSLAHVLLLSNEFIYID